MSLKNPSSTRFNSLKDDAAWRSKREVFDWPFGTGGWFRLERLSPGFLAFLANSRRKFEKVPAPAWIFLKHGCQSEDDE